jgi:pyridoxamine 5'-phosphate oxidase
MDPDLASLRQDYELGGLDESDLAPTPLEMFHDWFDQARAGGLYEPNAMVLSTVGPDGAPSSRSVLLKGVTDTGFCFFTNHDSRKGAELAADPRCALLFGWYALQRQVRVEGAAEQLPRSESEAYFASRPRASQLGAWASAQSSVVGSRADLQATYAAAEARFDGVDVSCPPHWGGYVVVPATVEFWQGRSGRMHDRLRYVRGDDGWRTERLAP